MRFDYKLSDTYTHPENRNLNGRNATLAEHLGYSKEDRLLIVNADDFGLCESTNQAIAELYKKEKVNSVSLMVGTPGFDHAAGIANKLNMSVGLHLTLTSEWNNDVIKPVSNPEKIKSLLKSDFKYYSEITDLYGVMKISEIEEECRNQIEKALQRGLIIDHLDTHMGVLQLNSILVELYCQLAKEYRVPLRLGSKSLAKKFEMSSDQIDTAHNMGLIFPDNLVYIPMSLTTNKAERLNMYNRALDDLPPGVTEIYFHPTLNGSDFSSLNHAYNSKRNMEYEKVRLWDYEYLSSEGFNKRLPDNKIKSMAYSNLLGLCRS